MGFLPLLESWAKKLVCWSVQNGHKGHDCWLCWQIVTVKIFWTVSTHQLHVAELSAIYFGGNVFVDMAFMQSFNLKCSNFCEYFALNNNGFCKEKYIQISSTSK